VHCEQEGWLALGDAEPVRRADRSVFGLGISSEAPLLSLAAADADIEALAASIRPTVTIARRFRLEVFILIIHIFAVLGSSLPHCNQEYTASAVFTQRVFEIIKKGLGARRIRFHGREIQSEPGSLGC